MNRQQIFDMVADAIKYNEFKCIHLIEKDGAKNIVVTLDNNLCAYINEDNTAQIIAKGNPLMLSGIKRQMLIDLSIEGQAIAAEKARLQEIEDMKDKLPKWKEQQAVLEAKIREAEMLVNNNQEVPAPEPSSKKWFQKVFSAREELV